MKKVIVFALAVLLLFTFLGCNKEQDDIEVPVKFYYRNAAISYNSDQAVICSETQESNGYDLTGIINKYLQGPNTDECVSPFPAGVSVLSIEQIDSNLLIQLSAPFAELSGIHLTLACACLSKTIMELTQCTTVEISVPDATLNGSSSIIMNEQHLLLVDSSVQNTG